MGVSAEAHKIFKCSVYSGGVDDVLLRLPLIELIIKDANLMPNWCLFPCQTATLYRTISNMYIYPFNPQLGIKAQVESHDKNPQDQRNAYV